jgi:ferrochelatase
MLEQLAARGEKSVLIVPIQFLADHLEVLYDLDIAAKMQCQERGIAYHRIELPNDHLRFAQALAAIAEASMLNS